MNFQQGQTVDEGDVIVEFEWTDFSTDGDSIGTKYKDMYFMLAN